MKIQTKLDSVLIAYLLQHCINIGTPTVSLKGSNNQCLCSGDTLTYECTTFGESGGAIATIWTGTAFDCPQTENKLTLLHTLSFTDTNPLICNDGAILVRGILVVSGGNYTSQLNITVNSDMNGQTVECFYDNGFRTQVIGNFSMTLTEPFPSPTESDISVNLVDISTSLLVVTFEWSPVSNDCSSFAYHTTFDCGLCPNTTTNTQVVCTDIMLTDSSQCTFTVQTIACGTIAGNTATIPVPLQLQEAPQVTVTPTYNYETMQLIMLSINIGKKETLNTRSSNGPRINSSSFINHYNIELIDTVICATYTIPATTCITEGCQYTFNVTSSACDNPTGGLIVLNVLATNSIGSGPPYTSTFNYLNKIVEVIFIGNFTHVICHFLAWREQYSNSFNCSITYGTSIDDSNQSTSVMGIAQSNVVILDLSTNSPLSNTKYHFTLYATDDYYSAAVVGTFIKREGNLMSTCTDTRVSNFSAGALLFGAVVGAMGTIIIIFVVVISILVCILGKRKVSTISTTGQPLVLVDLQPNINREASPDINTETNVAYKTVTNT